MVVEILQILTNTLDINCCIKSIPLLLVLVQFQVLDLDPSSPTSLQFGLGTFFGPDLVHV